MQPVTLCPLSSSHEKTLAADRVQATLLLACEGSGLGPEGEDEPDPGLDEETGTLVERDDERSPDPR